MSQGKGIFDDASIIDYTYTDPLSISFHLIFGIRIHNAEHPNSVRLYRKCGQFDACPEKMLIFGLKASPVLTDSLHPTILLDIMIPLFLAGYIQICCKSSLIRRMINKNHTLPE